MYEPQHIPPKTLTWVMEQAQNELNAYLCEGDPSKELGDSWPSTALAIAARCRVIAGAATRDADRDSWLRLADDYESAV